MIKQYFSIRKSLAIAGVAVFMGIVAGAFSIGGRPVTASDCGTNAILKCGAATPSEFISEVRSGNGGTQPDLATIYAAYGLSSGDYDRFATTARSGVANKNGANVVVDGRVVGTSAYSLGRNTKSGASPVTIGGKTYYEQSVSNWSYYTSSPVMVLFNQKGQVQTIVMNECGNAIRVTPNNPTYSCNMLQQTKIDRDTFEFWTDASAANGASINKVVYTFSDGTTETQSNPATKVTKNFSAAGTYTASVTVYVNVPGNQVYAIAPAGNCVKTVTVEPAPTAACTYLKALATADRNRFVLEAAASAKYGAVIEGYDFTVKNSAGTVVANPTVNTGQATASVSVLLADSGAHTASVSVRTSVGSQTNTGCQTTFNVTPPPTPVYSCDDLTLTPNYDTRTVSAVVKYTAKDGATYKNTTLLWGDSKQDVISSTTGTHTYGAYGTYTVKANMLFTVNGVDKEPALNPSCSETVTFTPPTEKRPSVKIEKKVEGAETKEVEVGKNYNYTVKVTNDGEVDLKNVVVHDTPAANTNIQLVSANGVGTISGNTWSYTIPSLKIGDSMTFTLTAKVTKYTEGTLVNTACVNAPEVKPTEPTVDDSCDNATVTVPPVVVKNPNISITKTVDGEKNKRVAVGQQFEYKLVITNTGEVTMKQVVVSDTAQSGLTLLNANKGTITSATTWTMTIGELKIGESVEVILSAKVVSYVAGNLVNTACVNAPEVNTSEPNKQDSCDTAAVDVTPPSAPQVLPDTGAGSVVGLFGLVSAISAFAYRLFLNRRLSRDS